MKTQKITNWLLVVVMIISTIGMIYFGIQKEGYHVDEMYSYGLANSEYLPFMHFGESEYDVKDWMLEYGAGESFADLFHNLWKDFQILQEYDFQFYNTPIYQNYLIAQANSADTRTTTWVSGQDYRDYLGVSASNTFNYASVYYNQRGDVHPPFYYMLLHTICSIFQGTFSKWYALSINIAALLLTMWLLYRMISKYVGNEKIALAVVALYGFSNGFFTTAMYLRMYALMTLLVVAFCYRHLKIFSDDYCMKKKDIFQLMLVTLLGYMTHYYFVLYAISMAAVFAFWMCIRKKWRPLIRYILSMGASAAIGLCVWPFAVKHVFSGYRGQASLNVILNGEYHWIKIKLILQQVFNQLFGGHWWIPIVCGILLLAGAVYYRKKSGVLEKGTLLILPMLAYTIFVAQIVPFYVERYVMCTYPFWCLLAVLSIWMLVRMITALKALQKNVVIKKKDMLCLGALAVSTVLLFIINNGFLHAPSYLGTGGQELITVPDNSHCVYVLPDGTWNESAEDTLMLSKCEQVAIVYQSNLYLLENTYQYKDNDCIIVTIHNNLNEKDVLPEVKKVLGISHMEESFREGAYNTVRIYFQ